MSRSRRKPKYCLHKASGNAFVRINGKCHYLGKYDSPESRERYEELIARWLQDQRADAVTLTVDELALRYFAHAETYYREDGRATSELSCIKTALRFLVRNAGTMRVRDFGPLKLKMVCEAMIKDGHCRISINKHVGRIRRMFRWGTESELVPPDVYTALTAVQGLRRGRCEAVESEPVRPVPDARRRCQQQMARHACVT